ncbi:unnamed protein product, partial [Parnassius mnemosyne]
MNTQPTTFRNYNFKTFVIVLKYPIHSLPSRYCLQSSHSASQSSFTKVHRSTGIIMLPVPSSYSLRYSVRHGSEPYCLPLLHGILADYLPSSRLTADYKAIPGTCNRTALSTSGLSRGVMWRCCRRTTSENYI